MARWTFEDYANGAMAVVGIAMFANSIYQAKVVADRECDRRKADRWVDEANARLSSMLDYMQKERASKECYKQALTAAKNVISYEVREVLTSNNYHMRDAEMTVLNHLDRLIAQAN